MQKQKLVKIEQELRHLRQNCVGLKPRDLIRLAKQLGRRKKPGNTNEPTYIRKLDPALSPPLSIPKHASLKQGTARSIINALLDDVDEWKQFILLNGETDDTEESDDDDDDTSD